MVLAIIIYYETGDFFLTPITLIEYFLTINPRSGKFSVNLVGKVQAIQSQEIEYPTTATPEEQVEAAPDEGNLEEIADSEPN